MILTFSRDSFVEAIIDGIKIHTIREDKSNRWKKGRKIQFWRGNPRNVKNNPYCFAIGMCIEVAKIEIYPKKDIIKIQFDGEEIQTLKFLDAVAKNDGFSDWEHMKEWFTEDFKGKIIFWGPKLTITKKII